MKKRPLCTLCLIFLIIRSILLVVTGGDALVKIPASSAFSNAIGQEEVIVEGQVYKKTDTSKNQILYLKNNSLFTKSNIIIYDDSHCDVAIGEKIRILGQVTSFACPRNPGNFDSRLYYAKQNIYASVWAKNIMDISGEANAFLESLYQIRQKWKTVITESMSDKNSAVLNAMLLSEKSDMDPEVKEQYQKAGISHVLAISGLHISFIGLGIYRLLRRWQLPYVSAGIAALMVLSIYTLMIGFSVSVFRAYLMLLLRIGADIAGRVYDMLTAVMLSAALLVLYQPLYLADAAFYLSHGAILGLILILPKIKQILSHIKWLEGLCGGLAVNLALFPILLWYYYEISTYSLLINLAVIPLMSVILSCGMCGSLIGFLSKPLGMCVLKVCDLLLTGFDWLSGICCELPFAEIVLGKPNWWEVMIYYGCLFFVGFLLAKKKDNKKRSRYVIAGTAILFLATLTFVKWPNGKLQVTMLDVGQGDCIFMKGPEGKTYLIDGGSSDVGEVAKYRMESFLKSQGVGSLDYVFVSHGDSDHYSGIQEMIERKSFGVQIQRLVLPENYNRDEELIDLANLAIKHRISVTVIKAGQCISEGELKITCLFPKEAKVIGNEGSMVLDVSFKKFDMLLTGDVEEESEDRLTALLPQKTYDVLKVAHHGSKNSTGERFLNRIKPRLAWISAGEGNSYGHPHKETLERLKKIGCRVYQTANYGAISLESDGEFMSSIFENVSK